MKLGAQLYTVRNYTQTLPGFTETLKKCAEIGYTAVQVSATCAFEPEWLAAELAKNGLTCPVTHSNPDLIASDPSRVAAEHKQFGCDIIGIGAAPGILAPGPFDVTGFIDRFLPAAKAIQKASATLGYHNHHKEFMKIGGQNIFEMIESDFPTDSLTFILDTYWVQYAGADPAQWIGRLKGRVKCIHLKDMAIVDGEQRMAAVGEGNINFDAILAACEHAGTEYLMVEQDECYGDDPFDCLKRSYQYLKTKGLD